MKAMLVLVLIFGGCAGLPLEERPTEAPVPDQKQHTQPRRHTNADETREETIEAKLATADRAGAEQLLAHGDSNAAMQKAQIANLRDGRESPDQMNRIRPAEAGAPASGDGKLVVVQPDQLDSAPRHSDTDGALTTLTDQPAGEHARDHVASEVRDENRARADHAEAARLLARGDFDAALERAADARALSLVAQIQQAKKDSGKKHLALAWALVRQGKSGAADNERQEAKALGVEEERLEEAINAERARDRDRASGPDLQTLAVEVGTVDVARSRADDLGSRCETVAGIVRQKLDYSTDAKEKALLRQILKKATECLLVSSNLDHEGYGIGVRCDDLVGELGTTAPAPEGSDAYQRRKRGFDACLRAIAAFRTKVEVQVKVSAEAVKTSASVPGL